MVPNHQLTGLVMAGGKSLRMGTDKGLITTDTGCWAGLMRDKLTALNLPVLISINPSQLEKYQENFNREDLIIDDLNIAGPLNGLLSTHHQLPNDDLLMLACDMINMEHATLSNLIETYKTVPDYDFYVYQNYEFAEPFCAIYTHYGLRKLTQRHTILELSGMSLQRVLNEGNTLHLNIDNPDSFNNFNSTAP